MGRRGAEIRKPLSVMALVGKSITRLDSDVWGVLDRHQSMPGGQDAYVGAPKIAREVGSDMRNIQRSIHRLEKIGLIRRMGTDKRYGTRRWKVLLPTVSHRTASDRTVSRHTVLDPNATVSDPSYLRSRTPQVAERVAEKKQNLSRLSEPTRKEWGIETKRELQEKVIELAAKVRGNTLPAKTDKDRYSAAGKVGQTVDFMHVTRAEITQCLRKHKSKEFGENGEYKQTWHGFAGAFDAILGSIRKQSRTGPFKPAARKRVVHEPIEVAAPKRVSEIVRDWRDGKVPPLPK